MELSIVGLDALNLSFLHLIFLLINIFLFDFLTYKLEGYSLLSFLSSHKKLLPKVFLVLISFVAVLEFYAHWLGKTWNFPYLDIKSYFLFEIPLLVIYAFYLLETYTGVRSILKKLKIIKNQTNSSFLKINFIFLRNISIVVIFTGTLFLLISSKANSSNEFFSVNYAPPIADYIFNILALIAFSWCMVPAQHLKRSDLLIISITGIISAFIYESFNLPAGFWRYTNIPLSHIAIFNIPLIIYLFWPIQYFILIPFYRLFVNNKEGSCLDND